LQIYYLEVFLCRRRYPLASPPAAGCRYCCGGGIRTCPNVCRVEIFKHWAVMMLGRWPAHNLLGEVTDDMEGPWDGPPAPDEP